MTLIVGAATQDYVVIVGDGNASNMDNQLLVKRDFHKVFALDNKLHFGVASSGFRMMDIVALTQGVRQSIDFTPPFTVLEKATEFGNFARNNFADRPDVSTDFIFGGFDCTSESYTTPKLFFITSENDYIPTPKRGRQLYYAPASCPDVLAENRLSNDSDYLSRMLFSALKHVSNYHPMIGGIANGVVISRDDNKWFQYDLNA